jgi:hypothetical protein
MKQTWRDFMNHAELKEALMTEEPVIYCGIEFKRVSAIIYRNDGKKTFIQAELLDKNLNSVSIAMPGRISRKKDLENQLQEGGTSL